MKSTGVTLLTLAFLACLKDVYSGGIVVDENIAYGYLKNYGKDLADAIRSIDRTRMIGGVTATTIEKFPYMAGLILTVSEGVKAVCGGALVNQWRVLTAAHCWYDGVDQATKVEVVLGSITLFTGGTRVTSETVILHDDWDPSLDQNDIAMVYLSSKVSLTAKIALISLPSGKELTDDYVGKSVIASGYGVTYNGGGVSSETLNYVSLKVIKNDVCRLNYPDKLEASNLCTSGVGGSGPCRGDFGGPLAIVNSANKDVLIGIASFGPRFCGSSIPTVYTRITSYMDFIKRTMVV